MWNGVFLPTFSKAIGTVKFVPLSEMTQDDWDILDYKNLRNVAKNRIGDMVFDRELIGFFRINIFEKARHTKPIYEQPASKKHLKEYDGLSDGDVPSFFENVSDVNLLSDGVEFVDSQVVELRDRLLWPTVALVALIERMLDDVGDESDYEDEYIGYSEYDEYQNLETYRDAVINEDRDFPVIFPIVVLGTRLYGPEVLLDIEEEISDQRRN